MNTPAYFSDANSNFLFDCEYPYGDESLSKYNITDEVEITGKEKWLIFENDKPIYFSESKKDAVYIIDSLAFKCAENNSTKNVSIFRKDEPDKIIVSKQNLGTIYNGKISVISTFMIKPIQEATLVKQRSLI